MKRVLSASLLLISITISLADCAQFAPDTQFEVFDDLSGGLYTSKPSHLIPKNFSPAMRNVLIDEKFLEQRGGWQVVGGTSPNTWQPFTFIGEYIKDNGDHEMIVSDSSQIATTKDFMNYTVIKTTLAPGGVMRMVQGQSKALLTDGVNPPLFYDGSICAFLNSTNGYPTAPIAKYPAFHQGRFWLFNSTANNSDLRFSDFITTDAIQIDPLTDIRAWPPTNQLYVGRGDGAAGSGLIVRNGQLEAHKYNNSIWNIFGSGKPFVPRKINAHVGTVSHDAIVIMDDAEYFPAKDGWYEDSGQGYRRLTDLIQPDIELITGNLTNIQSNLWDTFTDFLGPGTAFQGTTVSAAGVLAPLTSQVINKLKDSYNFATDQNYSFTIAGATTTTPTPIQGPYLGTQSYNAWISSFAVWALCNSNVNTMGANDVVLTLRNLSTKLESQAPLTFTAGATPKCTGGKEVHYFNLATPLFFNTSILTSSNVVYKIDVSSTAMSAYNGSIQISSISILGHSDSSINNTTGSFTSQVVTVSANITFWDQFNTIHNTNGGAVNFYIKGSTALVGAISTEAWTVVTPGNLITLPIAKRFVQWATTISAVDPGVPANVDLVEIKHNESAATDTRPMAIDWQNRLWMFVSTQTNGSQWVCYVKAKSTAKYKDAWMPMDNMNVKSITKFNNNFYAGSATAAVILRLDVGTNDNGQAINAYYQTPDFDLASGFYQKTLLEYLLDVQAVSGGVLSIGTSTDGRDVTTQTVALDGLGRALKHVFNVDKNGRYFHLIFRQNTLDKTWIMNSFAVGWMPYVIK